MTDFLIIPSITGNSKITSFVIIEPALFKSKTPDPENPLFASNCDGSPGVKIKLIDNSKITLVDTPNSIAGIVGFSSTGPFNKILYLSNHGQVDKILGSGFNNPEFNQGLYATRAILNNGGFVEFVRPYGELVDPTSQTERELKSDAYVFRYNYNPISKNNVHIDFFSATRHAIDGYSVFGNREIFTAQKTIQEGTNYNFTLDKNEDSSAGINEVALFSIINEDPTTTVSASSESDSNSDKIIVSFASYNLSTTIIDYMEFTSQPIDNYSFSTIDETEIVRTFEFYSSIIPVNSNIHIKIGSTLSETLDNIVLSLSSNMLYHTIEKIGNKIEATIYFGIKDKYNPLTQYKIFTEILDTTNTFTVGTPVISNNAYLLDSSVGIKFLHLGLVDEVFVKDSFDGSLVKKYVLNNDGIMISKLYLSIDYFFGSNKYSFSGTIVPYTYNAVNMYIKNSANSMENNFKFLINSNVDLLSATTNPNFNLGNIKNITNVKVATTANILLTGTQIIDGISLISGDYVLVKDQLNQSQNGIYTVSVGNWERTSGVNKDSDITTNLFIFVTSGTTFNNTTWKVASQTSTVILDSTNLRFYEETEEPIIRYMTRIAFDENDPAYINNAEWQYTQSNRVPSDELSAAWTLFLDKNKSNADFLLSSGTCIKNLFFKNIEELDYNIIGSILRVCELRKDMFAIFDGIDELNIDTAIIKMSGVGSFGDKGRWGAIFDGRSIFNDKIYTKLEVSVVKSIEVGAIISNNRRGGLYWITPAGKDFGTIPQSLANRQKYIRRFNSADDVSSDVSKLYAANINPTRLLKNTPVIYGQKTMLKKDTDLNRLNVTMLVAGLHKRLSNFLDNKMLKLNTYAFRMSITEELNNILNKIKSANPPGLNSFEIRCDDTNNTKETICQNKLIIDITLFPAKSSECIILRTTVQRTENSLSLSNFIIKNR